MMITRKCAISTIEYTKFSSDYGCVSSIKGKIPQHAVFHLSHHPLGSMDGGSPMDLCSELILAEVWRAKNLLVKAKKKHSWQMSTYTCTEREYECATRANTHSKA